MSSTLVRKAKPSTLSVEAEPEPHLFLLVEGLRPQSMSVRYRLGLVKEVVFGRGEIRWAQYQTMDTGQRLAIRIPDPWMSGLHARIVRRDSTFIFTDEGSTNGSVVNGKSTSSVELSDGDIVELGQTFFLFRTSMDSRPGDPEIVDTSRIETPRGLLSLQPTLAHRFELLSRIVKSDVPTVLIGASGTGKEVIAKTIHDLSGRTGDFVAVNCGALPENLVESELFGYKKGSFSGASRDHPGLVLTADGGTLFLDEIGDLPLASQAALLRVLQEREVLPVGGTKPTPVDFRLLCATHRDMDALVAEGKFREDLYGRLSGFCLHLPRLSERLEDIGILISLLLRELHDPDAPTVKLSNETLRLLLTYSWPRNIRQLRATLNTALALAKRGVLEPAHFPELTTQRSETDEEETPTAQRASGNKPPPDLSGEQLERRALLDELLREHKGNISAVARAMGKARPQIQRWIKRYRLDPRSYKS